MRRTNWWRAVPALLTVTVLAGLVGPSGAVAHERRAANQPPSASNATVATRRDTPVNVMLSASDPDGDPLTYAIVAPPRHGTVTGTDAARVYRPETGYIGPDLFTFKANDGALDSNVAAVSLTVSGVTTPLPPPAKPSPQKKLVAARVRGRVLVRLTKRGRFVPVTTATTFHFGVLFDTTQGTLRITVARNRKGGTSALEMTGGEFVAAQDRTLLTTLTLTAGKFGACGKSNRSVRRLWGDGKGKFRTQGRYSAATVSSAHWLTDDRCDGTLTYAKRGTASVHDYPRRRTVVVEQGRRYLARP